MYGALSFVPWRTPLHAYAYTGSEKPIDVSCQVDNKRAENAEGRSRRMYEENNSIQDHNSRGNAPKR